MFKVRQAKATPAPPTRRARIRRTSSRRSGYAFSHAQGYGDLVTSGRFLRRPALTRSSGFTHAGRTTTSFSPMGRSAGYSPTGRPQNNKVPDVEVTSLQMYRTITDSAPWRTTHLGVFGEIWEQIINYWLESYMMLAARSVQRSYLLQWRACLGFPEKFMSKIFHTCPTQKTRFEEYMTLGPYNFLWNGVIKGNYSNKCSHYDGYMNRILKMPADERVINETFLSI